MEREEASLSRAERRMDRRSRWADIKERRSSPRTEGGIRVPEFERFCVVGERVLVWGDAEVAAETAEARRE